MPQARGDNSAIERFIVLESEFYWAANDSKRLLAAVLVASARELYACELVTQSTLRAIESDCLQYA